MTRLAPTIMVQGTASNVGKSLIATGLCRLFRQEGLKVAPFKAQNMALNAAVTKEGHEIGRAQAAQADAAGVEATSDMNPILLKPEGERRSQVIVQGRPIGSMNFAEYHQIKPQLRGLIQERLTRLRTQYDLVVIEGAGSPAEINLKQHDLVNMFVARSVSSPVLLVGDIDRGGVFASFVGTMALLEPSERALVKGFIVNKFRGDLSLLTPGLEFLHEHTGVPVLGVLPYVRDHGLAEEDSLGLETKGRSRPRRDGQVRIAIVKLPRISNFDEFGPLEREEDAQVSYVGSAEELRDQDLVILPGTKHTLDDLAWLKERGLAEAIVARAQRGERVLGICGGCQMLGGMIDDRLGIESEGGRVGYGLGLLPLMTLFQAEKRTARTLVRAARASWLIPNEGEPLPVPVLGYEIHCGRPTPSHDGGPTPNLLSVIERNGVPESAADGYTSPEGHVIGTMLHGLLEDAKVRRHLLQSLRTDRGDAGVFEPGTGAPRGDPDHTYDRLASVLREHLDGALLNQIIFGTSSP